MLDLGTSINVMPDSVYNYLELGLLTEIGIVIQLADRSTIYPRGVIEDVLVKVENLVFPVDFYVLDMKNDDLNSQIFLGSTFLKTSESIINVNSGTLTMEFDCEIAKFNVYDTMKYPYKFCYFCAEEVFLQGVITPYRETTSSQKMEVLNADEVFNKA
ncbi:uncharacterized protein [Primulina eburnea]|uniref:uncharacterized protein n=1 Tax=Primulina eburnea TaxID=1245227 RepID=UPI003C6C3726